jgi:hypothetical protein
MEDVGGSFWMSGSIDIELLVAWKQHAYSLSWMATNVAM